MAAGPAQAERALRLLTRWMARSVPAEALGWLDRALREVAQAEGETALVKALGFAPRRLGRADLILEPPDLDEASAVRAGWDPTGLSVDQAARIALLLASHRGDDATFSARVDSLCRTAEINELIAYYRGLAVFPAPDRLRSRAGEAVRSAITPVFEALAHRNPYPREMFDEASWNQMVVKAVFIGSTLSLIQGLDERRNPELAEMLVDYAHERWAAGRPVSPELWRCVGPVADERGLAALERVLRSGSTGERDAARRALRANPGPEAQELLARSRQLGDEPNSASSPS